MDSVKRPKPIPEPLPPTDDLMAAAVLTWEKLRNSVAPVGLIYTAIYNGWQAGYARGKRGSDAR